MNTTPDVLNDTLVPIDKINRFKEINVDYNETQRMNVALKNAPCY